MCDLNSTSRSVPHPLIVPSPIFWPRIHLTSPFFCDLPTTPPHRGCSNRLSGGAVQGAPPAPAFLRSFPDGPRSRGRSLHFLTGFQWVSPNRWHRHLMVCFFFFSQRFFNFILSTISPSGRTPHIALLLPSVCGAAPIFFLLHQAGASHPTLSVSPLQADAGQNAFLHQKFSQLSTGVFYFLFPDLTFLAESSVECCLVWLEWNRMWQF